MRVLLIGDPESIWTKEFIGKVLLPIGASVSIQSDPDAAGRFEEYFHENGVNVIGCYKLSPLIMKIPKLRVLYRQWRKKAAIKPYRGAFDAVIVLYVTFCSLKCAKIVSEKNTRIFAFFIGSDILRIGEKDTKELCAIMKDTKMSVVCESCQTTNAFYKKIGKKINVVANTIYLGNTIIPRIDEKIERGRTICKRDYDIPSDCISVCIGYNASPAQQHLKVIEQLKKLDQGIKKRIYIIIPAAYGGTEDYVNKINFELQTSGIAYGIFTEFLNQEETATFRVATDVFINAQTTDAMSASVMEAYYAGAKLISAEWLKYQEFSDWGLKCAIFKTFDELGEVFAECLGADFDYCNKSRTVILREKDWDTCKNKWNNLLHKGEIKND